MALEAGQTLDLASLAEGGDDLHASGAAADDTDTFAGEVVGLREVAGVVEGAFEGGDTGNVREVLLGEEAEGCDEVFAGQGLVGGGLDLPTVGAVVEGGGGELGFEVHVLANGGLVM